VKLTAHLQLVLEDNLNILYHENFKIYICILSSARTGLTMAIQLLNYVIEQAVDGDSKIYTVHKENVISDQEPN
jgi:predicted ferric reductase